MSSKVREVIRKREQERRARVAAQADREGLGSVTLETPSPSKTKAEIQDELTAAGVGFPKNARKADLEALLPGNTTPDLGSVVAEDIEEEQP